MKIKSAIHPIRRFAVMLGIRIQLFAISTSVFATGFKCNADIAPSFIASTLANVAAR
jgi:hypothetical protein